MRNHAHLALLAIPSLLMAAPEKTPAKALNPFFKEWKTPFGVAPFDQIQAAHFLPAFEEGMTRQKAEVEAIIKNPASPNFSNTIAALDDSGAFLATVERTFTLLSGAESNPGIQGIEEKVQSLLASHKDDLNLNEGLFKRVKAVYEQKAKLKLKPDAATLLEKTFKRFAKGGANLEPSKKDRFRAINAELSALQVRFASNVLKDTNAYRLVIENKADLAGLPEGVIAAAAEIAKKVHLDGKWVFNLSYPSIWPFMTYAENRELRRQIFTAYTNRCSKGETDNGPVFAKIAALRAEKAQLLGYKTYAHFSMEDTMAKVPENAFGLLEQIWKPSLEMAKGEVQTLQAQIDQEKGGFKLEPHDWWFYANKVKMAQYQLDEEAMKPYFPLEQVRDGAFALAGKLYGLTFTERKDIPVYHKEVKAFEVKEKDGRHVSILMMDFHPRPTKNAGAWCDTLRDSWTQKGKSVTPLVYNVCNFSRPSGQTPALLSAEEAETLFHEFGHALHFMLPKLRFRSQGVNGVAMDFVELPSQVMENWVFEPEMLKLYARHFKTGELIPQSLVVKKQKAANFNMGFVMVEKLAASLLDLDWHSLKDANVQDAVRFEKESLNKWGLIPQIISRYRTAYFKHAATDYAAAYYSYTWSEVLDSDAFQAFKETGNIFNPAKAKAFRTLLSKGSSEDAGQLYRDFRGREPKVEALIEKRGLK